MHAQNSNGLELIVMDQVCSLSRGSVLIASGLVTCSGRKFKPLASFVRIQGTSTIDAITITNSALAIELDSVNIQTTPALYVDNSTVSVIVSGANSFSTFSSHPLISCDGHSSISVLSQTYGSLSLDSKAGPGIGAPPSGNCREIVFQASDVTISVPAHQPAIGSVKQLALRGGRFALGGTGAEAETIEIARGVELECRGGSCLGAAAVRFSGKQRGAVRPLLGDDAAMDLVVMYSTESQSEGLSFPALHFGRIDGLAPGAYTLKLLNNWRVVRQFVYDATKAAGFLVSVEPGQYQVQYAMRDDPENAGYLWGDRREFDVDRGETFIRRADALSGLRQEIDFLESDGDYDNESSQVVPTTAPPSVSETTPTPESFTTSVEPASTESPTSRSGEIPTGTATASTEWTVSTEATESAKATKSVKETATISASRSPPPTATLSASPEATETPLPSETFDPQADNDARIAYIAGGVVGGLVLIVIIAVIIVLCRLRNRERSMASDMGSSTSMEDSSSADIAGNEKDINVKLERIDNGPPPAASRADASGSSRPSMSSGDSYSNSTS
jgi:hypothetical protein